MWISRRAALLALAPAMVVAFSSSVQAEDAAPVSLKKGDRIVFLGDSITAGGVRPKGYVTLIKQTLAEKHPDLGIEIIGAGVSGNKVPNLQQRLDKDVLAKKPTIVVIYIGINDVWHGEKDRGAVPFRTSTRRASRKSSARLRPAGARVILCTPSVIGEKKDGANTLDKKLDEYADISRKVAKETNVQLCDLRAAFVNALKERNPDNKERGILTGDRVHLNDAGNRLVAETMLKSLGE